MKAFEKTSLIILCCFALGFIGLFLPVTRIQYQIITMGSSAADEKAIVLSQGFSGMYGDKYGRDALPCRFGTFTPSNSLVSLVRINPFLNFLGRGLSVAIFSLWMAYVVRLKLPLSKFTLLVVAFFGALIAAMAILNPDQPMCSSDVQFQVTSFAPFWLTFIILIGGVLFGLRANQLMKASEFAVSGIVGKSNSQP